MLALLLPLLLQAPDAASEASSGSQAPPAAPDVALVSPEQLQATLRALCEQPRLAGSLEARAATAHVAEVFAAAGLQTRRDGYWCWLPRQTGQSLELAGAKDSWTALDLRESGFEEDPWSLRAQQPPMHGLTAAGTAQGRVVYAGFGTEAEFARLRELLGEELDGSIALCRYGALYRGQKVANAEAAGCAGALLYTDPQDDGAVRGPVLPEGPWRPSSGIQRGSVYNGDGDPLTPGRPALREAERIKPEDAVGLVGIPSLPLSWANARKLMAGNERELGALPTTVRITVEQERDLVLAENVIGVLPGSDRAEEWILIGGHRDSWGFGAVDNGTGSTVLLETARVLGEAVARGWQPRRTLIFCSWDAEEWGLVGSTEWVEHYREELREHAVAYLNLDVAASGPRFDARCTPGLVSALNAAAELEGLEVPSGLGTPGGGSDHVPFLELGGIEVMGYGFTGGSGSYHSALDTPFLVETHLDPGFVHHASAARLSVRLLTLLAGEAHPVDGVAGWLERAGRAAGQLPATDDGQRALKEELVQVLAAAGELWQKRSAASPKTLPWRFHRAFLEGNQRSFLWRTDGYGATWFPELRAAWDNEARRVAEFERIIRAAIIAAPGEMTVIPDSVGLDPEDR